MNLIRVQRKRYSNLHLKRMDIRRLSLLRINIKTLSRRCYQAIRRMIISQINPKSLSFCGIDFFTDSENSNSQQKFIAFNPINPFMFMGRIKRYELDQISLLMLTKNRFLQISKKEMVREASTFLKLILLSCCRYLHSS